ncbi:uncharacterized protein E0L32_007972 [Thyridium curvatum]|uniref:Transmembrane protein n=1 Tax=Thyridium curvatum TaxID=1093900 RepID=A0A507B215_9PEZI|nr:uncharacterized protein E0L32_007972 [Thyridium curvatum]TPX11111.1 hypothetical protein E0L32_007972 [Thyridium curvatum]
MAPLPAALSELPNQLGHLFHRGSEQAQSLARDAAAHLAPTVTLQLPDRVKRQSPATVTVTVTAAPAGGGGGSGASTLSGGAIAGIVIGSVVGILLLLWIIRSCMNIGAPPQERESWYHDVEPTSTRRRHSGNHHHHSHSRRGSVAEVRTSSRPPVVVVRDDARRASKSPRRPSATYAYEEPSRGRSGRRVYDSY